MANKLSGYEFYNEILGKPQFVLAPMVDQSELAWRMLARENGTHLCYSPMFHASLFANNPTYRKAALQTCAEDRPLIIQFCANSPDTLLAAASLAADHCDAVDLNLGCPQTIAKRGHYGAFLQEDLGLVCDMIAKCHAELKVPITAKIRVFTDVEKTVDYALRLQAAGAQILGVHGRTREQKGMHTSLASWDHIKAVKKAVSIPVIANGNIETLADALRCMSVTGADAVMSAEGHLHNPALFLGKEMHVCEAASRYLDMVSQYSCPVPYIRGHIFKLMRHICYVYSEIQDSIAKCNLDQDFRTVVHRVRELSKPFETQDYNEQVKTMPEHVVAYLHNLPQKFWICQPYRRPEIDNENGDKSLLSDSSPVVRKRRSSSEMFVLAKQREQRKIEKRMKKRKNDAAVVLSEKVALNPCLSCRNPRSDKCAFQLCRRCCNAKTQKEALDCLGHLFRRTGLQKRPRLSETTTEVSAEGSDHPP